MEVPTACRSSWYHTECPAHAHQLHRGSVSVGLWLTMELLLAAETVENLPAMEEARVQSMSQEEPLEKERATHSNISAWRILWTKEPHGLQSTGLQRIRHN